MDLRDNKEKVEEAQEMLLKRVYSSEELKMFWSRKVCGCIYFAVHGR